MDTRIDCVKLNVHRLHNNVNAQSRMENHISEEREKNDK